MKNLFDVVGAVILRDENVLCARRGPDGSLPGLWEFPGGKIEANESPKEALAREIAEELNCIIKVGDQVESTTYEYDFAIITLTTFYCVLANGEPNMTEHSELRWLAPELLKELEWAPADIPAVERITQELGKDD
mgnify:CR=1 FL=1